MLANDLVVYIPKSTGQRELVKVIWDKLSQGKTAMLKGFVDTNSFKLLEEAFLEEFGCFPD